MKELSWMAMRESDRVSIETALRFGRPGLPLASVRQGGVSSRAPPAPAGARPRGPQARLARGPPCGGAGESPTFSSFEALFRFMAVVAFSMAAVARQSLEYIYLDAYFGYRD